jgi:hypothetical protein
VVAFALDEALAIRDEIEERWRHEEAKGHERLPAGFRYETAADFDESDRR